jgi:hypothetical protein
MKLWPIDTSATVTRMCETPSRTRYTKGLCQCDRCKGEHAAYQRKLRASAPPCTVCGAPKTAAYCKLCAAIDRLVAWYGEECVVRAIG